MAANTATTIGMVDASITVGGARRYVVAYEVETTDASDQGLTACRAAGIPSIGSSLSVGNDYDNAAFVQEYQPQLKDAEGSRKYWQVLVVFSSEPLRRNETSQPITSYEFPWLAPARVSGSGVEQEHNIRKHYPNPSSSDTEWLRSSAGEQYDDVYGEYSVLGITIEKAYAITGWSLEATRPYIDRVNQNTFWGAPQDYYKMVSPFYRLLYTGQGIPYWDVRYEFKGRAQEGWNGEPHVDEGTYYIELSTGLRRRFDDDWRLSFAGKGKLDGTGRRLGYVESEFTTVNYPPNGINKYRRADFAGLNIPTQIEDIIGG